MIRLAIIVLFSVIKSSLFCQVNQPDSLVTIPYKYFTLNDSIEQVWKNVSRSLNVKFPNIYVYKYKAGDSLEHPKVAYTINNEDWFAFELPFQHYQSLHRLVNLDNIGQPELIIEGYDEIYIKQLKVTKTWFLIFNLDSIPTQLFKICQSYSEKNLSIGLKRKFADRSVKIANNTIIVSPIRKDGLSKKHQDLTLLPAGNYSMQFGKILREK